MAVAPKTIPSENFGNVVNLSTLDKSELFNPDTTKPTTLAKKYDNVKHNTLYRIDEMQKGDEVWGDHYLAFCEKTLANAGYLTVIVSDYKIGENWNGIAPYPSYQPWHAFRYQSNSYWTAAGEDRVKESHRYVSRTAQDANRHGSDRAINIYCNDSMVLIRTEKEFKVASCNSYVMFIPVASPGTTYYDKAALALLENTTNKTLRDWWIDGMTEVDRPSYRMYAELKDAAPVQSFTRVDEVAGNQFFNSLSQSLSDARDIVAKYESEIKSADDQLILMVNDKRSIEADLEKLVAEMMDAFRKPNVMGTLLISNIQARIVTRVKDLDFLEVKRNLVVIVRKTVVDECSDIRDKAQKFLKQFNDAKVAVIQVQSLFDASKEVEDLNFPNQSPRFVIDESRVPGQDISHHMLSRNTDILDTTLRNAFPLSYGKPVKTSLEITADAFP